MRTELEDDPGSGRARKRKAVFFFDMTQLTFNSL